MTKIAALASLANIVAALGSIPTVRVSSAQARGRAGQYPYWGAVRYEVRIGRDGRPINVPLERASSDRRSKRLAKRDALSTGRMMVGRIGHLTEQEALAVLVRLGVVDGDVR